MPEDILAVYDKVEDVPEAYKDLYTPVGEKVMLTGIKGVKTEADVARVQRALDQERTAHNDIRDKLKPWGELDPTDTLAKLDRYPELEAAAAGKIDEEKMEELVSARSKSVTAPLERENAKLKEDMAKRDETISGFEASARQRTIHDEVRQAAEKGKIVAHAIEDVLMLSDRMFEADAEGRIVTKEGVGVTPGISPEVWLQEMQEKRPHWWPPNQGGGAGGDGGGGPGFSNNPWTADHWNLTQQGQVIKGKGREIADQMAKAAGVFVGAVRPAAKK